MRCTRTLLAATFVLGLAACGGSSSAGSDPSAASVTTANGGANQAYVDCLTQHGVDASTASRFSGGFGGVPGGSLPAGALPDGATRGTGSRPVDGSRPTNGSFGTIDASLQKALTACQSLAPQGGLGGGINPATANAIAPYLSCLADNGVVVPTTPAPAPGDSAPASSRGGGLGGIAGIDRSQPAFAAADSKCSVLLPAGAGNGGPGVAPSSPTTSR